MDVELTLPAEPVTLPPGVPVRVPVLLRNPYAQVLDLRIYLARGRAAGWATVDPPTLRLGPGETAEVAVVLRTPPEQPPSSSLVPFTVHAEQESTGEPAGFATALLTVAMPVPVAGDLVARPGPRHTYDLRLANETRAPAPLRITAELDPPRGSVEVRPEAVMLEPGAVVAVTVRAKPSKPLMGTPKAFAVVVKVSDAYDAERAPYLTEVATGTRKPRVSSLTAGIAAVVLALGATAAIWLSGVRVPLPGRGAATTPTTRAVAQSSVRTPYAILDVFPHRGADGGKTDAESEQRAFAAKGLQVRMVDSLSSDVLADEGDGFWVLLQDGFASAGDAQSFCTQWLSVAPKCRVSS